MSATCIQMGTENLLNAYRHCIIFAILMLVRAYCSGDSANRRSSGDEGWLPRFRRPHLTLTIFVRLCLNMLVKGGNFGQKSADAYRLLFVDEK